MLRITSCLLLIVTAAASPWMLGGYSPWCYALAPLGSLLAAIALLGARIDMKLSRSSWCATLFIGILLGYVWLQVIPLPHTLLNVLTSPARLERLNLLLETEDACGATPPTVSQAHWIRIASDPPETKRQWAMLAAAAATCLIAMLLASDERCRLAFVTLMAVNGAVFSFLAILQRASAPKTIYWILEHKSQHMPFGGFINRNHAGLFLAISGLFSLFGICLFLSQRLTRRSRGSASNEDEAYDTDINLTNLRMIWLSQKDAVFFSLAFCALICAMSSIVAASRSGALAFGAVIVVATLMLLVAGADRRLILVIGVLGGIAAIASGSKFLSLLGRFKSEALEDGLSGRLEHWSDVLDQAPEFAVTGVGYGNYAYATLPYLSKSKGNWFQHADNQFVEAFVELGAIGSLLTLSLVAALLIRSVSLIRSVDLQSRIVGLFGVGLVAIGTINAMGDFALAMPGVMLPMAMAVGFVFGYRQAAPKGNRTWNEAALSFAIRLTITAVLVVASAIGLAHFATGTSAIAPEHNFGQWAARTVSNRIGEPNPSALANDAEEWIAEFTEAIRERVETIEPSAFEPEMYILENLALLKKAAEIDEVDPVLRAIGDALKKQEMLVKAKSRYQSCVNLAPMRFENHIALAKLDLLLCPGEQVKKRIALVRTINPSSAVDAGKAGVLCIINGDFEFGGELLQHALREDPRLEQDIFAVLKVHMSVQEVAKFVLKGDVQLLVNAADRGYRAKSEWAQRAFLYAQVRHLIERGAVTGFSAAEMNYYLAKSKRMSGDRAGAIADLEAACEQWPTPRAWLDELVLVCEENRDLNRAKTTLERIASEFPYDPNVETHIQELTKRMRGQ